MSLEVTEVEQGVFAVVGLGHYQEHDPDLPGHARMTRARAVEVLLHLAAQIAAAGVSSA